MWPELNEQDNRRGKKPTGQGPSGAGCFRWMLVVGLVVTAALVAAGIFTSAGSGAGWGLTARPEISYSEFRQAVQDGNVERVTLNGDAVRGEFREPVPVVVNGETVLTRTLFTTYMPAFGDEELLGALEAQDVEVVVQPMGGFQWSSLLITLLPLALLGFILWPMISQMQAQGRGVRSMLKSRAREYRPDTQRVTFEDVAGASGAKTELREIIAFLRDPLRFQRLGGSMPRGALLIGPPGTGKTLLARAVAGEANVPFFSLSGSDFMEMFVGVGASRVRDLFAAAKQAAPSIIFIDELDSIGRRRGAGLGGGHDEREQTLNQLLSEMDGFEVNENVVVMAATNRPDILDPALLRPGRFDRRITVDLPTTGERREILGIHARGKPFAPSVDLDRLAQGTPGFSGADLRNILNEAALLAGRAGKDVIDNDDLEQARDKVLLGLKREGMVLSEAELNVLAYHEAGHALLAAVLPQAEPLHKVTIVPRGRAMGVTQQLPQGEKYIYPRDYLVERLAVMLGGRAAEMLAINAGTTGAENDLMEATRLARKMVAHWGMSERLGLAAYGHDSEHVFLGEEIGRPREYSESIARIIDEEVHAILDEAYECANRELGRHRDALDRLAAALRAHEELSGEAVLALLHDSAVPVAADGHDPQPLDSPNGASTTP